MNRALVVLATVLALTACDRAKTAMKTERFPGFTKVGTDPESAKLYIDMDSVKQNGELVTLKLLRVVEGGYVIQDALTDCRGNFQNLDGVQYKDDGTSDKRYSGDARPYSFQGDAAIAALVKKACDKDREARAARGDFNDIEALELLYGPYKSEAKAALWQGISPPAKLAQGPRFSANEGLAKPILSQDYRDSDKSKHLFLTATRDHNGDCHICPVLIGGAIFVRAPGGWKIERKFPFLMISGAFGEPFELKWTQIGRNHFALFENATDSAQGYFWFRRTIIEVGEDGGVPLLSVEERADSNQEEYVDIDLTLIKSPSDYWDAKVVITSRKAGNKSTIEQIYRYSGGKYELLKNKE